MSLPFKPGCFDTVFCKGNLHDTRDHVGFLRNCHDFLVPGGLTEQAGFDAVRVKKCGVLACTFAGFPEHLGVLRCVPGNALITRLLPGIDRVLCAVPGLSILGCHVVVVGRRTKPLLDGRFSRSAFACRGVPSCAPSKRG